MGTILASSTIAEAAALLNDAGNVYWLPAEMLSWYNSGLREIVKVKPDANAVTETILLAVGTKQTIPDDGIQLIDVIRNMGADGLTPGSVVHRIDREEIDAQDPSWHITAWQGYVSHYVFDDSTPHVFYTYTQISGAWYVEISYSKVPTSLTLSSQAIPIDNIYANSLTDYILYRAYNKDADHAANVALAGGYYSQFLQALGVQEETEDRHSPRYKKVR